MNAITATTDINEAHRLARGHAETAVQYAIRCGELLTAKKATLKHGEWQAWIAANCEFEYPTAARYMKAASEKSTGIDFSTLSQLYQLRAAENPEPPALPAPFDLSDPAIVYSRAVGTKALLVQASAEHAGFAHILQIDSDQGGGAIADYTRRAVRSDYVLQFADRMQPKGAGTAWEALNEGPNHVFDLIAPWIAEDRAVDLAPAP